MADTKISALSAVVGLAIGDKVPVADISDLTKTYAATMTNIFDLFLGLANTFTTNQILQGFLDIEASAAPSGDAGSGKIFYDTADSKMKYADSGITSPFIWAKVIGDLGDVVAGSTEAGILIYSSGGSQYQQSVMSGDITMVLNGTTTIGANKVLDSMISSTFLKNIVEDTTPQLGANLDCNTFNINLDPVDRLYLDGGIHTYISEASDNDIRFVANAIAMFRMDGDTSLVQAMAGIDFTIHPTQKLLLDNNGDTYITEASANTVDVVVGATQLIQLTTSAVNVLNADLVIPALKKLIVDGSTGGDTYIIESAANEMDFFCGGVAKLRLGTGSGESVMAVGTAKNPNFAVNIKPVWNADIVSCVGANIGPSVESANSGMAGLSMGPTLRPGANLGTVYGAIRITLVDQALDDTTPYNITNLFNDYIRVDLRTAYDATITNAYAQNIASSKYVSPPPSKYSLPVAII